MLIVSLLPYQRMGQRCLEKIQVQNENTEITFPQGLKAA